jgi:hypothetical protein
MVVSKDCPHCRELLQRAKDAVELLTKRGLMIINVEDFPDTDFLQVYKVQDGDLRATIPTPQVICLSKNGDVWAKVYHQVIMSAEEFHDIRRFLEAKIHWLKLWYGKLCFETRGRKPKKAEEKEGATGEASAEAQEKRRRGRRKKAEEA